jgi:uncharacterized membrane protein
LYHFSCFHSHNEFSDLNAFEREQIVTFLVEAVIEVVAASFKVVTRLLLLASATLADLAGTWWERPTKTEASRERCWSVGKTGKIETFAGAPVASLVVRCGIHGGGELVVADSAWRQWDSGLCEGKVLLRAGCGEHRPIWGRRYLCSLFAFHFLKFP